VKYDAGQRTCNLTVLLTRQHMLCGNC